MDHVNEYFAGSSRLYAIETSVENLDMQHTVVGCMSRCGWASLCLLASFTMLLGQARIFSLPARFCSQGPVIFDTITTIYIFWCWHCLFNTVHFISCSSSFHPFFQIFFHHGRVRFPTWDKSLGQHPESPGSNTCEARWLHVRLAVCAWCSRT